MLTWLEVIAFFDSLTYLVRVENGRPFMPDLRCQRGRHEMPDDERRVYLGAPRMEWAHRHNYEVRVIIEHRLYDFPDFVRERRGQVNGYLMSDSYSERYLWTRTDLENMKRCIEFQVNEYPHRTWEALAPDS